MWSISMGIVSEQRGFPRVLASSGGAGSGDSASNGGTGSGDGASSGGAVMASGQAVT